MGFTIGVRTCPKFRENRKAEKRKQSAKKICTLEELNAIELEEIDNIHFSDESDYKNLTDEGWNAIRACGEIADKFL